MLRINNLIKISIILFLIYGVACIFMGDTASAAIDDTAHWPVEVASQWNAVYGKVTGLLLEDGDSVGMFDAKGNCYGASLVKGGYYFLSAFMWEEADPSKAGDFTIPGFKDGEEVIFRAYKESTGEEYTLLPSDGGSYKYAYNKDRHNPVRIDLVYDEETVSPPEDEEPSPPSDEETWPYEEARPYEEPQQSSAGTIYSDSLEWLYDKDESEGDVAQDLKEEPEETKEKISYEEDIDKKDKIIHKEPYDEREPTDYYERKRPTEKSSRRVVDKSESTARADKVALSKYATGHEDKEIVTEEAVSATPAPSRFKAIENEASKKNLKLFAMIILVLIIAISVVILLKKSKRI